MDVAEFVRREASRPGYPGACCRMADRWVVERLGFSPLARAGRNFSSDADVENWLAEPGGIAVAVNRVMRANGFQKTKTPQAGDVGLVLHAGRICAAIHAGSQWVSRDDNGMIGMPLDAPHKAWRVADTEAESAPAQE